MALFVLWLALVISDEVRLIEVETALGIGGITPLLDIVSARRRGVNVMMYLSVDCIAVELLAGESPLMLRVLTLALRRSRGDDCRGWDRRSSITGVYCALGRLDARGPPRGPRLGVSTRRYCSPPDRGPLVECGDVVSGVDGWPFDHGEPF